MAISLDVHFVHIYMSETEFSEADFLGLVTLLITKQVNIFSWPDMFLQESETKGYHFYEGDIH